MLYFALSCSVAKKTIAKQFKDNLAFIENYNNITVPNLYNNVLNNVKNIIGLLNNLKEEQQKIIDRYKGNYIYNNQ